MRTKCFFFFHFINRVTQASTVYAHQSTLNNEKLLTAITLFLLQLNKRIMSSTFNLYYKALLSSLYIHLPTHIYLVYNMQNYIYVQNRFVALTIVSRTAYSSHIYFNIVAKGTLARGIETSRRFHK